MKRLEARIEALERVSSKGQELNADTFGEALRRFHASGGIRGECGGVVFTPEVAATARAQLVEWRRGLALRSNAGAMGG